MRDEARLRHLAQSAGAKPADRLSPLQPPLSLPNFLTDHDISEVRRRLTEKRTASGYKDPSKKISNILKSKKEKQDLKNPENWTFSLNERRDLVDATIRGGAGTLGSSAGIAQACIELPSHIHLDVNIRQANDDTDKNGRRDSGSRLSVVYNDWLEIAASQANGAPCVALLASRGTRQTALDKALGVALINVGVSLTDNSRKTVEQLLLYGANPNQHASRFLEAVRVGNVEVATLCLQAPKRLLLGLLSDALLSAVKNGSSQLVSILLAYGADPTYQRAAAFLAAVEAGNLTFTSLLLTASSVDMDTRYLEEAVAIVSKFPQRSKRVHFLDLLLCAGVHANIDTLQDALYLAVTNGDMELVSLLISHGTSPSRNDSEAICWAVSQLRLDVLELLLKADVSPTVVSKAVDSLPPEAPEHVSLRVFQLLIGRGAQGGPWGACLLAAVGHGHLALSTALIEHGASIDYENAHAVRTALRNQDLALVGILMQGSSTPHVLSKALPHALKLPGKIQRSEAVSMLLQKGVTGSELDIALRNATSDTSLFRDPKLVEILVQHGASISYGETNSNCIHIVTSRGDYELLSLLLTSKKAPSPEIVSQAVPLAMRARTQTSHSNVLKMTQLLLQHGARGTPVAETLIDVVRLEEGIAICKALLDGGADVNYKDGLVIGEAFRKADPAALQIICATANIEKEAWARVIPLALDPATYDPMKTRLVLDTCKKHRTILEKALVHETGRSIIREAVVVMLLGFGASVDCENGAAITGAIRARSLPILKILLEAHPSGESISLAFDSCIEIGMEERLPFAKVLINAEVPAAQLSRYLKKVIEEGDNELLRLMLDHGADTGADGGASFIAAGSFDDTTLFEKLVKTHSNVEELIPTLIRSIQPETKLISLLTFCLDRLGSLLPSDDNELLFLAMQHFPRGAELMRFLLIHGCPVGLTRMEKLESIMAVENVTPLLWALHQPRPGISDSVILTLLKLGHEANPDFVTDLSDSTAMIRAAETGRHSIIERMLELEPPIDISFRNNKKRSALFYACRNGDLATVAMLLKAKARPNDGSLHEAAREVNPQIVSLLLAHGHDARLAYKGFTPLADMCRNAHPNGPGWESRAFKVAELLLDAGTDPFETYGGKTILHLALDNDQALEITTILLDFPQISTHINDDAFLYEDDTGICYSPCKYAQKFYEGPPTGMRDTLKQALVDRNCKPRLFSKKGIQPDGAIGVPKHIEEVLNMEALRALQHAQDIKRMEEKALAAQKIMVDDHQLALAHSNERHQTSLSQAQQLEAYEQRASERKHTTNLAQRRAIGQEEDRIVRDRHQLVLQNEAAAAVQRKQILDADRSLEYNHTSRMALLDTQTLEKRSSIQRKLILEQENAASRQQERNLLLLNRQDESVRIRAKEMKVVAGLAGNQNGHQPLRLESGAEWGTVD